MQKAKLTKKEKIIIYITLKIANFIIDIIVMGFIISPITYMILKEFFF